MEEAERERVNEDNLGTWHGMETESYHEREMGIG